VIVAPASGPCYVTAENPLQISQTRIPQGGRLYRLAALTTSTSRKPLYRRVRDQRAYVRGREGYAEVPISSTPFRPVDSRVISTKQPLFIPAIGGISLWEPFCDIPLCLVAFW